jgi:hypothetical protein
VASSSGAFEVDNNVWPDQSLENGMLCDAEQLIRESTSGSLDRSVACHIKALLARVRDLEADRERLSGQLVQRMRDNASLAAQIVNLQDKADDDHGLPCEGRQKWSGP